MAIAFKWMSVTKARVSQVSSKIFNGSGSRDLLQWGGGSPKIVGMHLVQSFYGGYDPVQYHLRTKASHKFYL